MYGQTVMSGYDRYGYPVYRTIPVSHYCQAQRFDGYRSDCRGGEHHGYRSYGHGGYGYDYGRRSGCDSRPRIGFGITIVR